MARSDPLFHIRVFLIPHKYSNKTGKTFTTTIYSSRSEYLLLFFLEFIARSNTRLIVQVSLIRPMNLDRGAPLKRTGKFIVVYLRGFKRAFLLVNACPLEKEKKKKNGYCCGAQCRKPNCHLAWHYTAGRNEPGGSNERAIAGGESRTGGYHLPRDLGRDSSVPTIRQRIN